MRKSTLIAVLAVSLVIVTAGALAGGGPWSVAVWQAGVPTSEVQAGSMFEIRGSGFHARVLPVKVCFSGSQCRLAELDRAGNFSLQRSIGTPGSYTITVHQARDFNLSEWHLRAQQPISVTN